MLPGHQSVVSRVVKIRAAIVKLEASAPSWPEGLAGEAQLAEAIELLAFVLESLGGES